LTKNIEIQNEIMENQIEKQNIGMSVDIDIEVTENEIKNKKCSHGKWNQNLIKIKSKYRHECQHCSHQHSTKIK